MILSLLESFKNRPEPQMGLRETVEHITLVDYKCHLFLAKLNFCEKKFTMHYYNFRYNLIKSNE